MTTENNTHQQPEKDYEFEFMMLSRLRHDCDYFLGNGGRYAPGLYYGEVSKHIEQMKALHNQFPENMKPEWLTMEQINQYEQDMTKQPEYADNYHHLEGVFLRGMKVEKQVSAVEKKVMEFSGYGLWDSKRQALIRIGGKNPYVVTSKEAIESILSTGLIGVPEIYEVDAQQVRAIKFL